MNIKDLPGYDPEIRASDDEKCFGVLEADFYTESSTNGKRTVHRFQIIDFLRNNTKLREVRDLNELKLYSALDKSMPYRQIALLEHSVGECKEIADAARERGRHRANELILQRAESTLVQDTVTRAEQAVKVLAHQSHFGPLSAGRTTGKQRNERV